MYLIYYNMDQIHQLFNEPEKWIFTDILDGRKYYVWSNICDDDVLGMTLTTLWMDFTLLLLLWTSLLFTSPRISWPCLTSRYVFWDTCFSRINWDIHSIYFHCFYFRFLSFLVSGEEKDRENLSKLSLSLLRWESSEFLLHLPIHVQHIELN
jgi:hypothetical protein